MSRTRVPISLRMAAALLALGLAAGAAAAASTATKFEPTLEVQGSTCTVPLPSSAMSAWRI